jgi:broad specificity phosphatase PhoE
VADGDTTVAVVAHGGTLQVLLSLALGVDLARHWQFKLGHASLSELWLYEDSAILSLLNDCHHLGRL